MNRVSMVQEPLYSHIVGRKRLHAKSYRDPHFGRAGRNIDAIKRLTGRIPLNECESPGAHGHVYRCLRTRHSERPYCHAGEELDEVGGGFGNGFLPVGYNMYRRMRRLI